MIRDWHTGLSIRRGFGLVGLSRNAVKAPRAKIDKDKPLVAALTKLAAKHPRLGYRMLHHPVNTWSSERASGSAGIRSTDCAAVPSPQRAGLATSIRLAPPPKARPQSRAAPWATGWFARSGRGGAGRAWGREVYPRVSVGWLEHSLRPRLRLVRPEGRRH